MHTLIAKWDLIERKACAVLLGISVSLAFYEVLSRYLIHTSIDWSSEITLYAIAWCTVLGASRLIKEDGHVGVSILVQSLGEERKTILQFMNNIICLLFTMIVIYSGVLQVHGAYVKGVISESSLKIPFWIPYLIMPLGGLLFSLRMIERLCGLFPKIRLKEIVKDPLFIVYIVFFLSLWWLFRMDFPPTFILVFGLLVLLILGLPIAFALGAVSLLVLYFQDLLPLAGVAPKMFESVTKFSYLAIPFFILSGTFMTKGGIARPLLTFADELLKWVSGGFAIAVMFACLIFSALSGASAAIAAALGIMAVPVMIEKGYPKRLSLGILSAGGTLGVLVPPSTILILYGAISGESIADLFKAGILPGILIGLALCVMIYIICKIKGYGTLDRVEGFKWKNLGRSFLKAIWALIMPIIILGGIYSGIFTPTEAAAVSVFYAVIVCSLAYSIMRPKKIMEVLEESSKFNSLIYFIIMTSTLFSFLVTMEQLSNTILEFVISLNMATWLFLLIINISVFIMGCFMGPGPILLIIVPILYPILGDLNIHPIHLGILLTINMELAFITPPFGMNLFVLSAVCDEPVMEVVKGHIPFLCVLFGSLVIISYIPAVSLLFIH
ncbi:MAG: TRAP transporter large permease subunit [Deltaproteobacteria bacterium]|nr:TRAP transporter large permease subunit [Deltaproteobacteria bacterium]MBW2129945.1 TRAP transporter large permease subunit [Deltaproteobacteria bacterium]